MLSDEQALDLDSRLAALDWPDTYAPTISGPDSLLQVLVSVCTKGGYYYSNLGSISGRCIIEVEGCDYRKLVHLMKWRDALAGRSDIALLPDIKDCYSGNRHLVLMVQRLHRFPRWSDRAYIPESLRTRVYRRDGFSCVRCGTQHNLSLDHITPWSWGGKDTEDNLQTMCRSCNSQKGARYSG